MDANRRIAVKLAAGAIAMFGFGYVLVPIYDLFCDVTGLNGKTGAITQTEAEATAVDTQRVITVAFDANVNAGLPWRFGPEQRRLQVHPGEIGEAFFYAENFSGRPIVGQAVPSVAPGKASPYFNKTECFCFTQQVLAPGERRRMPVRFVVDPDLPPGVATLTLSYTFFEAPAALAESVPPDKNTKQRS